VTSELRYSYYLHPDYTLPLALSCFSRILHVNTKKT